MGREAPITATDHLRATNNNSPLLAADPTDERFVVVASRLDAPDFGCALHLSGDGGRTWVPAPGDPVLPAGAEKCYGPEIAFDRKGKLYLLFVGLAGSGNRPMGAFLSTSADRGRSFSTPRQVLGPGNFGVRLAIDVHHGELGRLHLVWLATEADLQLGGFGPPPNPITAAYSDDGGATFSTPVQVSDVKRSLAVAPSVVVTSGGVVHVSYYDLGTDSRDYYGLEGPVWTDMWSVVLVTSTDKGRHFGHGRVVDSAVVPPGRVMGIFTMPPASVVADGRRVCAAWTDARHGDPDVLVRCSLDSGEQWTPAVRVNDDPPGNGRSQYLPRLALAPGGRLDVAFLDRRRDVSNLRYDAYLASSLDGARTFSTNVRLDGESSDARIGASYSHAASEGLVEYGSRLGLLSNGTRAVIAWPDTRNSRREIESQDLVGRSVDFPVASRDPLLPVLAVSALAAAPVVIGAVRRRRRARTGDVEAPVNPSGLAEEVDRRRWMPRPVAMLAIGAGTLSVLVAGVASQPRPSRAGPLPSSPQVVNVTMREFAFDHDDVLRPGRVIFRVHNAGTVDHRFELYPLPDDIPPLDEQLHGTARRSIRPLVRAASRRPGQSQDIAADLAPGQRYGIICFLFQPPDGEFHALLGMNAEFRTPG